MNTPSDDGLNARERSLFKIGTLLNDDRIDASLDDARTYALMVGDEDMVKFLEKYMKDLKFHRRLKLKESITSNPAIAFEYYDEDRGEDDPYRFDEWLEKELVTIRLRIGQFRADMMREERGESITEQLSRLKAINFG